jgi:serine/threonine protein kinase
VLNFTASMNYMAPECVSHGYSETCDIWSLGCVLFELVTAWLYNSDEAIAKLQQVRNDPGVLDEVFEDISKVSDNGEDRKHIYCLLGMT